MSTQMFNSFEEACAKYGDDPKAIVPDFSAVPERFRTATELQLKLMYMVEKANTDENGVVWTPDWSDWDENKYCPWFRIDADKERRSGFGVSNFGYLFVYTCTSLGSRLLFKERAWAEHAGKNWKEYENWILIKEGA